MKKILISLLIVSTLFISSSVLFAMRTYEEVDFIYCLYSRCFPVMGG